MDPAPTELSIDYSDPQFFAALADPEGLLPHLEDAMHAIMTEFVAQAETPAPESDANKPGRVNQAGEPLGYYERGRGWWYPLKSHDTLAGGEIPTVGPHFKAPHSLGSKALHAKGFQNVTGYRLIPSSEQLEENWQADVSASGNEILGELTNFASYAGYVQGPPDVQTQLMKSLQWQGVLAIWNSDSMQATVTTETDKALDEYFNLKG